MRSRGFWSPLLAATLWAMGAGRDASAYDVWVETVDWVPTSSVVSVPSSFTVSSIVPTSFVAPTVYATAYATESVVLAPTRYVSSSYVVPTYYETRFRRSLFGRRLIPTGRTYYTTAASYFPTTLYYPSSYVIPSSYVVPTTYATTSRIVDSDVVATAYSPSNACCGDAVLAPTSVRVVAPERSTRAAAEPARRAAPSVRTEDDLDDAPALPSTVEEPPVTRPRPAPAKPAPIESTPAPVTPAAPQGEASPPEPQTPERQQSTVRPDTTPTPASPAPRADDAPAPSAPADDVDLLPAPEGNLGFNRREALRPVYDPARNVDPATRNVLFGRVRERVSTEPEEGVRVLLSNRAGAFSDRTALTDAFGRFAVRVPDGDWTVKVAMPSGRVYAVSEITVSNGLITDDEGRDVPSLTITR